MVAILDLCKLAIVPSHLDFGTFGTFDKLSWRAPRNVPTKNYLRSKSYCCWSSTTNLLREMLFFSGDDSIHSTVFLSKNDHYLHLFLLILHRGGNGFGGSNVGHSWSSLTFVNIFYATPSLI